MLSISNAANYRTCFGARGSVVFEFTPWWSTSHLRAGQTVTLWHVYHDTQNELRIFYDQATASMVFRLRRAGTNYDATKAVTLTRLARVRVGARWCSPEGEHGLPAYSVSVFVGGAKGTDATAAGAMTEQATSRMAIGYRMTAWKTPAEIGNCTGWWRADSGLYLNGNKDSFVGSGDRLPLWADASGNGRDWYQLTRGNQPIAWRFPPADGADLAASVDLPYVVFDGSDDYMVTSATFDDFIDAGAGALFAAWRPTAAANPKSIVDSQNRAMWMQMPGTGSVRLGNYDGTEDTVDRNLLDGGSALNRPAIAIVRHSGGNVSGAAQDFRAAAFASAASGNTTNLTERPELGRRGGTSTSYLQGQLFELGFFSAAPSDADAEALGSYLFHKWAGTVFWWNGMYGCEAYQNDPANGAIRFLQVSQLPWSDAEIAAKHAQMAAVL